MNKEKEIYSAILRSEMAFNLYSQNKYYHQALRIFKANTIVYQMLEAYSLTCDKNILMDVFEYLFHLEDWFLQFSILEKKNPKPEDEFVFGKLKNTIPYPVSFKNYLKEK